MIYSVSIFDEQHSVQIHELIELLDSYNIDDVSMIYHSFNDDVKFALREYYKQRMFTYLNPE